MSSNLGKSKGSVAKCDNLPVPYSDMKKMNGMRKSIGCDLSKDSNKSTLSVQTKKRLQKSTSMAWIARGGHGKQPTQLEETVGTARKASDCMKSNQASPLKDKLGSKDESGIWLPDSPNGNGDTEKKDYSISSIEQELLKQISKGHLYDASGISPDKSYAEDQMQELLKRCPYIEQLKQTSEKYRTVLIMLKTLARYNELMKKLLEQNITIINETELEKYSEFLKKNRNLRIEIKSILTEQKENERKIDEMKKNMNIFGIHHRMSQTYETETVQERRGSMPGNLTTNSTTKRELIKFRDSLLEENDGLLFSLKRKLM